MGSPTFRRGLRLLGHPVHPMLSDLPIASLLASVPLDVIALARERPWWAISFWTIVVGVVVAVPTACAGLIDYARIPEGRATKAATVHMLLMLSAVTCFGIDLLVRGGAAPPHGRDLVASVALDVIGTAVLAVGGWYGGELVFTHGVGVDNASTAPPP